MNWSRWIRQIHRWISVVFTAAVVINIVAIAMKKYSTGVGLVAVAPLALMFLSGLYLFLLPYATRWGRRRAA